MSARESWAQRRAQRQEREEVAPGGALPHTKTMNALHRCDRCGAQACVRVLLHSRQDLLFCAHHYRQHAAALARFSAKSWTTFPLINAELSITSLMAWSTSFLIF